MKHLGCRAALARVANPRARPRADVQHEHVAEARRKCCLLATVVVVCGSCLHLTSVFRQHPSAVNTSFGERAYVIHASAPRSRGRSQERTCRSLKGINNCHKG